MKSLVRRFATLAVVLAVAGTAWASPVAWDIGTRSGKSVDTPVVHKPSLVDRLESLGNFSILLTALETANLKDDVAMGGPFTLFAPTDQAFADLLAQLNITATDLLDNPDLASILLYHVAPGMLRAQDLVRSSTQTTLSDGKSVLVVLEGRDVLVNRAKVTRANVRAGNGIIHVIDRVLLPPTEPAIVNNLLDVLQLDGRFSVLLQALEVTRLDDALAAPGPLTLFAPTDEAFAALLAELGVTADQLLQDPDLASILLYHALGSQKGARQLLVARRATTLQGEDVTIRVRSRGLVVNDSLVINPNVKAPNGVIHTLDKVLLP